MRQKSVLGHDETSRIINAATQEAINQNWAVAIAVCDDGGHLLSLVRLDTCAPVSAYIATEKARTAALGRRETKAYEEMINAGRTAFINAPLLTPLEGGVPIIVDGQVIGAVGVSGVKPEQDAFIAKAGVASL